MTREEIKEAAEKAAYEAVPILIEENDQYEWDKAYIDFLIDLYLSKDNEQTK